MKDIVTIPLYKNELTAKFIDDILQTDSPLCVVLKQLFQLKGGKPTLVTILSDDKGEVEHIATIGTVMGDSVIDESARLSEIRRLDNITKGFTHVLSGNVNETEDFYEIALVLCNDKSKCYDSNFSYKFRHEGFMELFRDAYSETMKNEFKKRLLDENMKSKIKKYFKVKSDKELYELDVTNPRWATMTELLYQDLYSKHNIINQSVDTILKRDTTSIYHSLIDVNGDVAIILPNGCGCFERHNGVWYFSDYTLNKITFSELSTIIAKYLITHTQFTPMVSYKRNKVISSIGDVTIDNILIINFTTPVAPLQM
ncbi:MAG: hypothetical protein ACRC92_24110 [Peptostreptococcaceae bacterium]